MGVPHPKKKVPSFTIEALSPEMLVSSNQTCDPVLHGNKAPPSSAKAHGRWKCLQVTKCITHLGEL